MQVKKNPNKNLNRNRILYFQIGLSLVLLLLLISVEWKSYTKPIKSEQVDYKIVTFEEMPVVKLPKEKVTPKSKVQKPTEEFKEVDDETVTSKDDPIFEEPKTEFDPDEVLVNLKPVDEEPIKELPYELVQDVPIFPGCEVYKDNVERKTCMNKKLYKFIGKHFDTQLASELGLEGQHKIFTQFKVSHTGKVEFINARASHPKLKTEAQRVIELLPEMIPGKQRLKPVDVIFGLPINFKINN